MSVVIPFHDHHDSLAAALDSLQGQAALREVIIVDDASTSPPVANPVDSLPMDVIRWRRNQGPAAARNKGVAAASGEFVAFLDADDVWLPQKAELQLDALAAAGDETLGCLSGYYIVRRIGGPKNPVDPPCFADGGSSAILGGWIGAAGSTLMIRREPFLALGGYDETLRHYEDWDLLLRVSRAGRLTVAPQQLITTFQPPSTPSPLRAEALERFENKHRPAESGWRRRRLEAAVDYERASMHYRNGTAMACLTSLGKAAAKRPWHTIRRATRRLIAGIP